MRKSFFFSLSLISLFKVPLLCPQDTIIQELRPIFVRSEYRETSKKIEVSLAHRNPFIELQLRDNKVTTILPGVGGNIFVDVPSAVQMYDGNTNFLINMQPNGGLLSGISGNASEIRRVERSALRPALDEPVEITLRREEGIRLGIQPLELSFGANHTNSDSSFSGGFSFERHSVPKWIPSEVRRDIDVLGSGARAHGFLEMRGSSGMRASLEAYTLRHTTDVNQMLGFARYHDWLKQYYITFRTETPLRGSDMLQLSVNRQHGETALSVWTNLLEPELQDTTQGRFQNLTYTRLEGMVGERRRQTGIAFYELRRNSTIGGEKQFSGLQFFGNRQNLFGTGILRNFLVVWNGRIDFVRGEPHASMSTSFTRQAFSSLTTTLSVGSTWDATNTETLQDNLKDMSPVIPIAGQRVRYGLLKTTYLTGSHAFWFSIDARNATAEQFFPDARITGESYRLGYGFSSSNPTHRLSFSTVFVRRDLRLERGEEITPVPGSPRAEIGASVTYSRNRHTAMVNGMWRRNFPYPENRERIAINLGAHRILSLLYSLEIRRELRMNVSASNILKAIGENNFIAANGNERLAMPMVFYMSFEFTPSLGRLLEN